MRKAIDLQSESNNNSNAESRGCLSNTRLHSIWSHINQRCHNPKDRKYMYYGGRGITVCNEWKNSFKSFYEWSISNGYSDGLTIDRIENDGNYCPENCRWATYVIQNRNRRPSSRSKSGYSGLYWNKKYNKWLVQIGLNGKTIHVGMYSEKHEAISARKEAELKYWGDSKVCL